MGSKGDNTTTQKTAPDPAAMAAYQSLMERAQGVANTPYQPYTGELTAGVNAQQNLGIGNLNNATQAGQPWFDYAASMAHPIATSDIQRYQNPYTQQVVDATQAQFNRTNAQQQEGLKANAISKGALGGSRADIAAADMAYQQQQGQAPVIAGLYNQSYNNALAAAQQQQQAGFQGAGVGANIQQAGLQGAGAQIGAGTLQQQTEQARLNALYNQYQVAQAFPYQQTQWLAGVDTGVGSQMGGTSTTTAPAPSLFGQIAGAGLAGVGAASGMGWKPFSARGGRINGYDAGGSVGSEPYSGVGFIPRMQIRGGPGAPHAPAPAQIPQQKFDPKNFAFPKSGVGADPWPGTSDAAPEGGMSAADAAAAAADPAAWYSSFLPEGLTAGLEGAGSSLMSGLGGVGSTLMSALPEGVAAALPFLLLNRGGGVRGYADGGPPSFDDRWNGVADDTAEPIAGVGAAPMPRANPFLGDNGPIDRSQLPRQFFDADDGPDGVPVADPPGPGNALGYAPSGVGGGYEDPGLRASAEVAGVGAPSPSRGGFDWSSLSMPLMAAGLGMMASRSPHLGVAIGEGGLAGVQAYAEQQKQTAERGLAEKKQALDARRLDQMAQQAREHLALQTRTQKFHEDQADRPYREVTKQQQAELDARRTPPMWKRDAEGNMVPEPGGLHDPETIRREAQAKLPPSMMDAQSLRGAGEQYFRTGTFPPNTGRGIQGGQDRNAIIGEAYKIAADQGVDPAELPKRWQQFKSEQVGIQRFMSGKQGDTTRSLNVATDHVETLRQLAEALKNKDYPLYNTIANRLAEATGSAVPTNFDAAAQIVSTEVLKAVGVAGAGGVEDRAKIQRVFSNARSPDQLQGAINDVVRPLLVGQLRGLRRQFMASTGLPGEKFDEQLEPATQGWLKGAGHAAAPAAAAGAPKVGERKQFKQGWGVWDGSKWVPEKG